MTRSILWVDQKSKCLEKRLFRNVLVGAEPLDVVAAGGLFFVAVPAGSGAFDHAFAGTRFARAFTLFFAHIARPDGRV